MLDYSLVVNKVNHVTDGDLRNYFSGTSDIMVKYFHLQQFDVFLKKKKDNINHMYIAIKKNRFSKLDKENLSRKIE